MAKGAAMMRSEKEMMDLIMNFAKNDDRIRVVVMEGSKLNKNAPIDKFQDFDITFIVNDMDKYLKSDDWLDAFGKRIIMQKPEGMSLFPPSPENWFSYLLVFEDGNKMDLSLWPVNDIERYFKIADSLTKVLLDKDGICPLINEPSDFDYHVKKPSCEFVDDCCNEFWMLAMYVTKGLCRNELLFAIKHLNLMKEQMLTMISWKAGIETSFSLSVGKACKYLDKYVSAETWQLLMKSYKNDTTDDLWNSLAICCDLFIETTAFVAGALNYECPKYDQKVMEYIRQYIP